MILEKEVTILNINKEEFIKQIIQLGAKEQTKELLQTRYVYDFHPVEENKWIRLRTNGIKTTLTIKQIVDENKIDGVKEWEVEVSDFEETDKILNMLGYHARNIQQNKRQIFTLNNVEIAIDTWPLIPCYAELESDDIKNIQQLLNLLQVKEENITTYNVGRIYEEIYHIDLPKIKFLKFGESYEALLESNK